MHDDLFQLLTNDLGIAALFPGGIHHMSLPQGVDTWPALTFEQVARVEVAEDMEHPNDEKVDQATYQFSITADKSATAIIAADAFHEIFRNFRGTMGATVVQMVGFGNQTHLEERVGDKLRRRVILDYSIVFNA